MGHLPLSDWGGRTCHAMRTWYIMEVGAAAAATASFLGSLQMETSNSVFLQSPPHCLLRGPQSVSEINCPINSFNNLLETNNGFDLIRA